VTLIDGGELLLGDTQPLFNDLADCQLKIEEMLTFPDVYGIKN
jgi:hypothetical protein